MFGCFGGCTSLSGTVTINASITNSSMWYYAFRGVTGVTVQVPDCGTKAAIEAADGNSGVTVVFTADPAPTCP